MGAAAADPIFRSAAMILTGEVRGLSDAKHRAAFIAMVENAGPGVGVFASLALPARNRSSQRVCEESLKLALAGGRVLKIRMAHEENARLQTSLLDLMASSDAPHRGVMPHLWRMRDAFELMAGYEAKQGIRHDVVLCVRTDLLLPALPRNWLVDGQSLPTTAMRSSTVFMHHDQAFLGWRSDIETLSGAWNEGMRRGYASKDEPRPGLLPLNWSRVVSSEWCSRCSNFGWCLDLPLALGFRGDLPQYRIWRTLRQVTFSGELDRSAIVQVPLNATVVVCPWLRDNAHRWEQDVFLGAATLLSTSLQLACLNTLFDRVRRSRNFTEHPDNIDLLYGNDADGKARRKALPC